MDRQPMPYNQGYIPKEVQRAAVKRAPNTLAGVGIGSILGAFIAGPLGAMFGAIFGGAIGYDRDTKQQRK